MGAKIDPERLASIAGLLAAGATPSQIDEHCIKTYGVKKRQARRYRDRALAEIASNGSTPATLMLTAVYRKALSAGKFSAATAAAKEIQRLQPSSPEVLQLYKELGDPPVDDPLKCIEWGLKSLAVLHREIMLDPTLDAKQRAAALQRNARSMVPLIPYEEVYDAKKRLKDDLKKQAENSAGTGAEARPLGKRPARSLRAEPPRKRGSEREIPGPTD